MINGREVAVKKRDGLKNLLNPFPNDFSEVVELLEDEDVMDEDIARDMNLNLDTVRSLKKDLEEENIESPSVFFKAYKVNKSRRKV